MIEWEEIARRGDNHQVLLIDTVAEAHRRGNFGLPGKGTEFRVKHYRQLAGARWMSKQDIGAYVAFLKDKELERPGSLLAYADDYKQRITKLREVVEPYKGKTFSPDDTETLLTALTDFLHARWMWAYAYNYAISNKFMPDIIFSAIAEKESDIKKQNEYFNILLQLDEPSAYQIERQELVQLAERVGGRSFPEEAERSIQHHISAFGHLGRYCLRGDGYSADDIRQRLESVLEHLEEEKQKIEKAAKDLEKKGEILRKLNLSDDALKHIASAKAWAAMSNYAEESFAYAVEAMQGVFHACAEKFGITYQEFLEMRGEEMLDSLEQGACVVPKTELEARAQEAALILDDKDIVVLSGKELEAYKRRELAERDYGDVRELRGETASPGSGTGTVRLVLRDADATKVKKGDILVAPATNPSLVSAMERALAVVTDEGGLLSHAAIVSRELGIPCIVGTKIATKVLKDGDRVEVDTVQGSVKLIRIYAKQ